MKTISNRQYMEYLTLKEEKLVRMLRKEETRGKVVEKLRDFIKYLDEQKAKYGDDVDNYDNR